jgi:hypothetical protein
MIGLPTSWVIIGALGLGAVAFVAGMQTQKKFYQAAKVASLERKIAGMQADAADDAALIKELTDDARKHDQMFQDAEDRSTGDNCTVFDDRSLGLLNSALGYRVPAPAGQPRPGPRPAAPGG